MWQVFGSDRQGWLSAEVSHPFARNKAKEWGTEHCCASCTEKTNFLLRTNLA